MMDDLIEFNSQDEISGYNGHPVMTVDSEKQWLTHDDTIAHVTNSAQYAFGVNVPVVAQALGMDETVIYDGKLPNLNGALNLSESWNNFKQLRVRGGNNTSEDHYYSSISPSKAVFKISWGYNWLNEGYVKFEPTSDPKVWTYVANTYTWFTHTDTTMGIRQNDTTSLTSACNFNIVGIGRKENT
jgi:hypothetical protein